MGPTTHARIQIKPKIKALRARKSRRKSRGKRKYFVQREGGHRAQEGPQAKGSERVSWNWGGCSCFGGELGTRRFLTVLTAFLGQDLAHPPPSLPLSTPRFSDEAKILAILFTGVCPMHGETEREGKGTRPSLYYCNVSPWVPCANTSPSFQFMWPSKVSLIFFFTSNKYCCSWIFSWMVNLGSAPFAAKLLISKCWWHFSSHASVC